MAVDTNPGAETKQEDTTLLRMGNVSLILDSYDDIFSDFDPRPYSERTLSDDFLRECKKAVRDKKDGTNLELRLLVPHEKRRLSDEAQIKRRLKQHFHKHFLEKEAELRAEQRMGTLWFLFGIALIYAATLFYGHGGFIYNFMFVLLEPAGWFVTWNGLEKLFLKDKTQTAEYNFYKKMASVTINFYSY